MATPLQVRSAVAASRDGFPDWSGLGWTTRARVIQKTADILDAQKFPLAALITCESGKNRYEAVAEVGEAIDMLRYHKEIYLKQKGFVIPMQPENPDAESRSIMRSYGVWAVISPFNFPLSLAAGMAGAALITGNTILLKPTSAAPLSALKLFSAFVAAGVPLRQSSTSPDPDHNSGIPSPPTRISPVSHSPDPGLPACGSTVHLQPDNGILNRSSSKWGARTRSL